MELFEAKVFWRRQQQILIRKHFLLGDSRVLCRLRALPLPFLLPQQPRYQVEMLKQQRYQLIGSVLLYY